MALDRSEYAQILFLNVPKNYVAEADIRVQYTVTALLQPNKSDWLGIFKVGWASVTRDVITYVWAPLPEKYCPGQPAECTVVFEAAVLPKDNDEFYQFCYINSKGQVRGASTPFQFKRPSDEDFIEEDVNGIIMIIPKNLALEEKLQKTVDEVHSMQQEKNEMVLDKQKLLINISHTKKNLEESKARARSLAADNQAYQLKVEELMEKLSSAEVNYAALLEARDLLETEKADLEKKLDLKKAEVLSLEDQAAGIKEQLSSADLLASKLAEDQKRLAEALACMTLAKESVQSELAAARTLLATVQQDLALQHDVCSSVHEDLLREKQKVEELEAAASRSQAYEEELLSKIRAMEGQLATAISSSKADAAEVSALRDTLASVGVHLERLTNENYSTKMALTACEKRCIELDDRNKLLGKQAALELEEVQKVVEDLNAEIRVLSEKLDCVEAEREELTGQGSSYEDRYYALNTAYTDLKERLRSLTQERDALKSNEKVTRTVQVQQAKEVQDLRERLKMGEKEWVKLYQANEHLRSWTKKHGSLEHEVSLPDEGDMMDASDLRTVLEIRTQEVQKWRDYATTTEAALRDEVRLWREQAEHERDECQRLQRSFAGSIVVADRRLCDAKVVMASQSPERDEERTRIKCALASVRHTELSDGGTDGEYDSAEDDHLDADDVDHHDILEPPALTYRVNESTAIPSFPTHTTRAADGSLPASSFSVSSTDSYCCICQAKFEFGMTFDDKSDHVNRHFADDSTNTARCCPVCAMSLPDATFSQTQYEEHVNSHFPQSV